MKKPTVMLLIIGIMTLTLTMETRPEVIFLKDGSLVHGRVTQDAAEYITVRKEDNKTEKILRKEIMRILYTKLNMGKIYIQKRDGKGFTAFIVDEDQESYTFRKDLHSPAEFSLKRADVLFIADRNPSGLKGEAETDRTRLEWFPSYDPMKHYNVYIKKKNEIFALADSSKKPNIVLRGLSSNTEYVARVTGVDME
nr:fibronectin type III domain-containing protein [Spirochaetota bacterium]